MTTFNPIGETTMQTPIRQKPTAPLSKGEVTRLNYWGASGDKPAVLPLAVQDERMIVNAQGGDVAMMYGAKECRAHNAAYLVHAANAYPKLVAALRGDWNALHEAGWDCPIFDQWSQERFEQGLDYSKATFAAEVRDELLRDLGEGLEG